jgi:phosphotransferase system HPr-like phosphotransfer protein
VFQSVKGYSKDISMSVKGKVLQGEQASADKRMMVLALGASEVKITIGSNKSKVCQSLSVCLIRLFTGGVCENLS